MKEIGGYIEFEKVNGQEYYHYLAFNLSRSALRYLVRVRKIEKIYIPYYLCHVIRNALVKENVEIIYYHINSHFEPIIENYDQSSFVLIVNYFGLLSIDNIKQLKNKYQHIILDNTHAFFMEKIEGIDIIYNCRKYFGVADGAYLYTDVKCSTELHESKSMLHLKHLFGRFEDNASDYYQDYLNSEALFGSSNVMLMSSLTHNMLRCLDYEKIKNIRRDNFIYLHNNLEKINKIDVNMDANPDFMYPLLIDNGKEIKKRLISLKVYVPTLWSELTDEDLNEFEKEILNNLVLLPIDQRYTTSDMQYIIDLIKETM